MAFRSGERNLGEHIKNISLFTARFKGARREALAAFGAFAAAARFLCRARARSAAVKTKNSR
jgi:hypothetical protein